jgi:hypothetical protein
MPPENLYYMTLWNSVFCNIKSGSEVEDAGGGGGGGRLLWATVEWSFTALAQRFILLPTPDTPGANSINPLPLALSIQNAHLSLCKCVLSRESRSTPKVVFCTDFHNHIHYCKGHATEVQFQNRYQLGKFIRSLAQSWLLFQYRLCDKHACMMGMNSTSLATPTTGTGDQV